MSWSETDPTVFGGPGNQFIFGGTSWAGGYVLVGEEAPLPQGAVTGVVWVSADATHWSRLPDTARVFDHAEIGSIAAHGSTLVAIGQPRPDNPAAVQPPLTLEWTSTDGIHWVRNRGADSTIGTMSYATVLAGPTGFIAYGNTQNSSLVLLFSHDGLDWQRVGAGDSAFADASIGQITWTGTSYVAVGTRLQPSSPGNVKPPPGPAAAWWSADGITWHAADVGTGGYAINYFGAVLDGVVNAYGDSGGGGISPPIGWRSIDDGRTWRSLGPQTEAPGFGYLSTSLPVNGRVVRLTQSLPPLSEWSQDGETWRSLEASGSPLPQETRLMIAGDGMLIAVGQLEKSLSNDQVDSLVYVGVMR